MCVDGKVIFITGGAGGIGLAMVKKLLENGVKGIAIVDKSEESGQKAITEIANFGKKAIFIKTDITVKKELEEAFETTIKTYDQLDIVINNAGIINEIEWEKTVAVNLTAVIEGTYLAMQKYLPQFKSGEEGVVVNVASLSGFCVHGATPVYCTTKLGLIGLGQALGGEEFYKKYKVRVLTICPGCVATPLSMSSNEKILNIGTIIEEYRALYPIIQSPERVGEALIEVLQNGRSGSLWVTESNEPVYEIVVPHPKNLKVEK